MEYEVIVVKLAHSKKFGFTNLAAIMWEVKVVHEPALLPWL